MATMASVPQQHLEDPLVHLPRSTVMEYRKGDVIYGRNQSPTHIYLVIEGKVKVSRLTGTGQEVVLDIYRPDEFFGEAAFLKLPQYSEEARAFEKTKVMSWPASEIEALIAKQPRLGVALMQLSVQRNLELTERLESFSLDNISRRAARSLIRFSDRMGVREGDGSVRMSPLTHELLSQYVGTSREVITLHMNRFRRQGYLRYSRKGMVLYRDAFQDWLAEPASNDAPNSERASHAL